MATNYIVPTKIHSDLVAAAYKHRGYTQEEADAGARFSELTAWHGIKTHNAIKALHLDELFGSKAGGCKPGAKIEKLPSKFKAVERWNANKKLGQATAFEAMDRCMKLADEYGVGVVAVDNAFHYLWGGGYVIDAAKKGYLAYTSCTAALAEVVPFGGRFPTLGTNPHSWGFPTQDEIGFPICIDWATSIVAMGRIQQFIREAKPVPAGWGVDENGNETTDPNKIKALFPFGQHKGYGLGLIDEIYAGFIGGSLPEIRGTARGGEGEKRGSTFYFQVIHPEAMKGNSYVKGRTQMENVKAVIEDVLGHGNEMCLLPGQPEARWGNLSKQQGGLLFTRAEIEELNHLAHEVGQPAWELAAFKAVSV